MRDDFFWALFGGGFIVFWALLITCTQYLRGMRRLRERELAHKERMLSLEKGLPLPEDEAAGLSSAVLQSLSLGLGLLLLFAGIGLSLAFCLTPDTDSASRWTMGLIPAMAGIGLLLYSWISRRFPVGVSAS
ncbi:MAG TPA: DUF6249 domain-containing protein [Thermoanaerobaculia bacterium]|jgi:hypothetical protein|nr:DUF6249 domain-containing protein [Thermoanaerobaculia bacterium]